MESQEQAIEILVAAADAVERTDLDAVDTILHAIFYLRSGKFPFNRRTR